MPDQLFIVRAKEEAAPFAFLASDAGGTRAPNETPFLPASGPQVPEVDVGAGRLAELGESSARHLPAKCLAVPERRY